MKKDNRGQATGREVEANFTKEHPKTTVAEANRSRESKDVTKAKAK